MHYTPGTLVNDAYAVLEVFGKVHQQAGFFSTAPSELDRSD